MILLGWLLASPKAFADEGGIKPVPALGVSLPTGDQDDLWSPGYTVSLEAFQPYSGPLSLGGRISFHRWRVNAAEMLCIDDHAMTVEDEEGWRALGSASFLMRYELPWPAGESYGSWLEGGLSVNYLRNSGVYVKGFYAVGPSPEESIAVNREIRRGPKVDITAGLSLGLSLRIAARLQPSVRYEYYLSSDPDGCGVLVATVGVFAP